MKKILFAMMSVLLAATSCQERFDGAAGAAGEPASVTLNVGFPQLGTRAFSDGTTADKLQYAVYLKKGDALTLLDDFTVTDETIAISKQVTLQLVTGNTYGLVFWAAAEDAPYTVAFNTDGAVMTADYEGVTANDETLDAFFKYLEIEVNGPVSATVELRRPFAQINIGTGDYAEASAAGYTPTESHIKVSNVYSKLDLVSGEVSEAAELDFDYAAIPEDETFPVATCEYMAMAYALVSADQEVVEVSFDCKDASGDTRAVHTVGSVPVQRNYRTNIYGMLLTSSVDLNVIIKPEYEDSFNTDLVGIYFDEDSKTYTVTSAEGLGKMRDIANAAAAEGKTLNGYTIKLDDDIHLAGKWTPMNNNQATFDGQNHTIYGLYVDETDNADASAGLFSTGRGTVKNLTLAEPYVKGNYKAGAVAGDGLCAYFENITVTGATVISQPWQKDGAKYDDGNNAGGIVGYFSAEGNGYITDCTVENSNITAYRKVGGIAGYADCYSTSEVKEIKGNTVRNVKILANMLETNYDGYPKAADAAEVVGSHGANMTVGENTVENVTVEVLKIEDKTLNVSSVAGLQAIAETVAAGTTFSGITINLEEDLDLEGIEWLPIGRPNLPFNGTFDGGNHKISNIKVSSGNYVGLFGNATNAKIKNVKVENAEIKGRLGVAVIAGHPYTTDIENIEITGKVTVEGKFYVGTCGGGNYCYGNYRNITVDVESGSYVYADSVEDGETYATYVGGVVGHPCEGSYTLENITSNIDVMGSSCYVGGICGLAHYGVTIKNCKSTGNVSLLNALDKADGATVGGIAGCWNAGGANVTFSECVFEGTLSSNYLNEEELKNNTIVGNIWGAGSGRLFIDGQDVTEQHSIQY